MKEIYVWQVELLVASGHCYGKKIKSKPKTRLTDGKRHPVVVRKVQ